MFGERDNRAISRDFSSANSICHSRPNFQCWLIQSDLKSETDITYTKLKKAGDNSWKSGGKNIVKEKPETRQVWTTIYIIQVCKSEGKDIFQSLRNWSFFEKIRLSEYALKIRVLGSYGNGSVEPWIFSWVFQ